MYNVLICGDGRDTVRALKLSLSDLSYALYEETDGQEAPDWLGGRRCCPTS